MMHKNEEHSFENPYQYNYNGKELQETGMYDYGARFYMPDLGRWGVVDPLAEVTPHVSSYHYANNSPVMYNDPTGMVSQSFMDNVWNSSSGTTWYNTGTGFVSDGGSAMDYDGNNINWGRSYMDMLMMRVGLGSSGEGGGAIAFEKILPELVMTARGNKYNWNMSLNHDYNSYLLMSKITGVIRNWNYDINSSNMGQYIMNSKASMEVAEFEKFLFLEVPLSLAGGELFAAGWRAAGITGRIGNALSKITTADGFMGGSIGFKLPFNLNVGLYASENTLTYGTFKWSTIAPKALTRYESFGRNMLQITPEFQSTLGTWSNQVIPKGTYIRVGLVGQQPGNALGTWLQFYAPGTVPFVP
ncbi:RHS repeat-associated core domain-containing protein [Chryseobacterium profundimaris]|uniref:RHS repeat-associated core domain-containing protein n=2 Tax=Chryseobacterium profundimaris TaxID=1387275 RepID=A0ABY1NZG3_9FLAO|nr:RHS repeat-associated core domain-containing protein [Chryseobacterium profundimaris]